MKKVFFLFLAIFAFSIVAQAQIRKAALVSVFGSRNLSDNPLETKMYEKLLNDSSFNLESIVARFDDIIRKDFLPQFPFPFLTKDEVIGIPGYYDIEKLTLHTRKSLVVTTAPGYIPIAAYGIKDDVNAMKQAFKILPADVDVIMIAYIDFTLMDEAGFAGVSFKKVRSSVNLKLFDRTTDRIFKLKEHAKSDKSVTAVAGFVAETDKIMPLIESAAEKLFEEMQERMPKSLSKMTKKLNK